MSMFTPRAQVDAARSRSRSTTRRLLPLAAAATCVVALVGVSTASAAQPPVGLGTATSFAILAGAGITNVGVTTVTGDIGTFPTTAETGFGPGADSVIQTGVNHAGDAVTQQAKLDLVDAYNDAAGRGPATAVAVELGGLILTPGVYNSDTLGLTGPLTLDAQGDPNAVFVFQAASTLITASSSSVIIINPGAGANTACNIYWKVGSSATLGSASTMVGTVMAQESISLGSTATVQGRLFARTAAVTLINNTITTPVCDTVPVTPTPTTTTPATDVPADSSGGAGSAGSAGSGGSGSGDTTGTDTGLTTGSGTPTTGITRQLAFTG